MNTRTVRHKVIMQLHKDIANWHKDINGFYRFNWNEINGKLRSGVNDPVLLIESASSELSTSPNKSTNFNGRDISFLLLKHAGKADNYNAQDDALDEMEGIALDIVSMLVKLSKDESHWLYDNFDVASVKIEKVGPLFDNMYGQNVLYNLKNHESMCFDANKWNIPG